MQKLFKWLEEKQKHCINSPAAAAEYYQSIYTKGYVSKHFLMTQYDKM